MKPKIALLVATLVLASSAAYADGSFTGKYAAYSSASGTSITTSFQPLATLAMPKGKKKRVLEVEAQTTETSANLDALGLQAFVNDVPLEPFGYQVLTSCDHTYPNCSFLAHWWIDLDAAEAANPGMIVNQPLSIVISGITGSTPSTITLTARARMLKK